MINWHNLIEWMIPTASRQKKIVLGTCQMIALAPFWLQTWHVSDPVSCSFPVPFRELKSDPSVGRYWLETQGKQMVSALSGVTQGDHSGAQNESFFGYHFGHIWCPPHPPNMVPTRGKENSQQFSWMNDCSLCRPRKKKSASKFNRMAFNWMILAGPRKKEDFIVSLIVLSNI